MRKASQKILSAIFEASYKLFKEEQHNDYYPLSENTAGYLRHIF